MASNTKDRVPANFYYLFGFKKIKTPAQLITVVCVHIVAWLLFFTLPIFFFRIQISNSDFVYRELINKVFLVGFFYFNYFFLIRKFFLKKKRTAYTVLLLFSIILLLLQHLLVEKSFISRLSGEPGAKFGSGIRVVHFSKSISDAPRFGRDSMRFEKSFHTFGGPGPDQRTFFSIPSGIIFFELANVLSSSFILVLLGGFIHLVFIFFKNQDEKKSLENANLKAEINLLKSQVNPHFLFNTLNSIYSQVYHKSQNAEKSILKLSEILRYVIYDTSTEMTLLKSDIHYLSNYIDLQRMRLSDKVTISYAVKGDCGNLTIAPLLLITFIENAFKHGISYTHSSVINIDIQIFNKTITMVVSNPVTADTKFENEGIGLKNVKRRLDLLYRGNYWLDIVQDQNLHVVTLKINLNHD